MQEWRKIVAGISLLVMFGRGLIYRAGRGTKLQDPEFDQALLWAAETGIQDIEHIRSYPFQAITRAQAAQWYVLLAQDIGLVPSRTADICTFDDIDQLDTSTQHILVLSCQYGFFKGTDGHFYPDLYVTKANSLVALMRGLYPAREFTDEEPYRTPYITLAHTQGITQRPSDPYMMYLVTKYELLLQLWRVHDLKK
jgi:hypothetical protein